jgi:hypothetical protein
MSRGDRMLPSEAARLADAIIGLSGCEPVPEWVADLGWRVAAGEMSGDTAARIIVEHDRRERPEAFGPMNAPQGIDFHDRRLCWPGGASVHWLQDRYL